MKMKIAIIGGGITGLTTALALRKMGMSAQVFERAPQLAEVGAGIWMQPNALKVLDWLEIGDNVRAAGMPLSEVEVTDPHLRPFRNTESETLQDEKGRQIISIHRARLQQILFEALPEDWVHLGQTYQSHEAHAKGVRIQLEEREVQSDLLLAADGIQSRVRQQLFPDSRTRYAGQTCWRGISAMRLPEELLGKGREAWGKTGRFGFANVSPDEVYWFAVVKAPQGGRDRPGELREKLLAIFQPFHPLIQQIISQTPLDRILRNDNSDLKRLPGWHRGRTCLLGDASHATTPNMGQGACQGIEDAFYLSQMLSRHPDPRQAFAAFEQARRPKVDYIVNNSWRFGQLAHSPLGKPLMKLGMKLTPERVLQKQMARVFAVEGLEL
jgi:2-polyprenyl-6-methoxyphenol hydroxylase-like FAD-dependent oxidoreductase